MRLTHRCVRSYFNRNQECSTKHYVSAPLINPRPSRPFRYASTANVAVPIRYSSTTQSPNVGHVAILGGGVTGLTAAHYLTQQFPRTKITIFESQPRLGGWLNSQQVDTPNGKITFESGPRSLRVQGANGGLMLRLVWDLYPC